MGVCRHASNLLQLPWKEKAENFKESKEVFQGKFQGMKKQIKYKNKCKQMNRDLIIYGASLDVNFGTAINVYCPKNVRSMPIT